MTCRHLNMITIFFWIILIFPGCTSEKDKAGQYLSSGKAYFEQKEYDNAKIQLMNAVKSNPDSVEAHKLLASTYLNLGNGQEAFKEYLRLEQMEPGNIETLNRLAAFFLAGKKQPEAERRINAVLETDPDNIEALYLDAGLLALKREPAQTLIKRYQRILEIDPDQTKALLSLSRLYMVEKKVDLAEASIQKALAIEPGNSRIYTALYFFYLSRKNLDAAEETLKTLVAKKPEDPDPLVMLAGFYAGRQSLEQAEKTFFKGHCGRPEPRKGPDASCQALQRHKPNRTGRGPDSKGP